MRSLPEDRSLVRNDLKRLPPAQRPEDAIPSIVREAETDLIERIREVHHKPRPRTRARAAAASAGTPRRAVGRPAAGTAAARRAAVAHRMADPRTGEALRAGRAGPAGSAGPTAYSLRGWWSTPPRCPTGGSCRRASATSRCRPAGRRPRPSNRTGSTRGPRTPTAAAPGTSNRSSLPSRRRRPRDQSMSMPFGTTAEQTSWLAQYNKPHAEEPTYTSRAYVPPVRVDAAAEPAEPAGPGADRPAEQAERGVHRAPRAGPRPADRPPAPRRAGGRTRRERRAQAAGGRAAVVAGDRRPQRPRAAGRADRVARGGPFGERAARHPRRRHQPPPPQAPRGMTAVSTR